MSKRKQITSKLLLLPLLLIAGLLISTTPASAATPPDACFDFDSVTGTINDYYDNENNDLSDPVCTREVDIPVTIGGDAVTIIGDAAFQDSNLTSLTIPNSVTSIGNSAFTNNNLTSLTIPNSVTSMGNAAFDNNNLASVTISTSLTSIESAAFYRNNLTSVTIPSSVTNIGDSAFNNNNLTSVTIPSSVTTIGVGAFMENYLTAVVIPNSVVSLGAEAFNANMLESVTLSNQITNIGFTAFSNNVLSSVTIPNSVVSINPMAFVGQSPTGRQAYDALQDGDTALLQELINDMWHTRLYTQDPSNPNNLADVIVLESAISYDYNADGDLDDSLGGHLINPAMVTLNYNNETGDELQAATAYTGTGLNSYNIVENTTNDASLYYRLGSSQSFSAPAIAGYTTPAAVNFTFALAENAYTFMYTTSSVGGTASGGGAGGLAQTGDSTVVLVLLAIACIVISGAALTKQYASSSFKL